MLVIRMQRVGRKGHAQFRVVVQDSRRTPTSGNVVANLGHFNPHTKETSVDTERASTYINNGAQPSERVARLLKSQGVKLPDWVKLSENKTRTTKNPAKLRKNQPKEEPKEEEKAEQPAGEEVADESTTEETASEKPVTEEVAADEKSEESGK